MTDSKSKPQGETERKFPESLMAPYQGPGFPTAIYDPFEENGEALADNVESELAAEMTRRWNAFNELKAELVRLLDSDYVKMPAEYRTYARKAVSRA